MDHAQTAGHWLGLQGQVCAVTGAASGIGEAIATGLAAVGATVALLDRDGTRGRAVAQRLADTGARCQAFEVDVSDEAAVQRTATDVRRELGPVTALANNAGFLRAGALDTVSLEDWNAVLDVNLTGYLLCARAFAASMREAGSGRIVHVASIAAHHPQTRSGAYSASKAGILLLSRQMAAEWGPEGIRSNVVCPGMIRTPLSADFYRQPGFEARRQAVTANRRIGEPQDIADAVIFLLSPRADYINGAELTVDGGMDSMLMDLVPRPGYNDTGAGR
jgi:NAD(P)-dependent dehydrogenase (short-subunit alcohol dehydrogenase family)